MHFRSITQRLLDLGIYLAPKVKQSKIIMLELTRKKARMQSQQVALGMESSISRRGPPTLVTAETCLAQDRPELNLDLGKVKILALGTSNLSRLSLIHE